jgi:tight adherence protein C
MNDTMLLVAGLALVGGGLLVGGFTLVAASGGPTGVARSLAAIEKLNPRADRAIRELAFSDRVVAPSLGWLRRLARRLSPSGMTGTLQRRLDVAGNPGRWDVERVLAFKGLALVAGAVVGILYGLRLGGLALLLVPVGAAAFGFFLPDILIRNAGTKRQQAMQRALPDALDLLTVCVEAGLGFDAALDNVARSDEGPIGAEFARVLQEMQIGRSRTAAFTSVAERTTVAELKNFVASLTQADGLGIPVANVLREQSREMRLKRRQRAEEAAQKVPVKILFPLIFCILPSLFAIVLGPGALGIYHAIIEG